ncbi:MAG TPA: cupin domain-containing protein [Solirubrobacteraceae bacterium]|jgi:uncharacterized cupin superfamily protein
MSDPPPIVNLDAVEVREVAAGDIRFARRRLGAAAGCRRIGASHYTVPAGARQMPVHVHGDEEEIFHVLGGSGISWQGSGGCTVGPGDTVVQRPGQEPHTFLAGAAGLELLAFGSGSDTSITYLPRAKVMWCGPRWVPIDSVHPFKAEAQAGPLEAGEPGRRPDNVVALADVDTGPFPGVEVRALGNAGGAVKAGLNRVTLPSGASGAPPHCHALEEELFVVLEGAGTLALGDLREPLRVGDVVARPPSTGVAHSLTAGEAGLTYLAYGTREPGDTAYYPAAGKVRLRGLGVTIDVSAPGGGA